jgi:hypothetical protein
VSAANRIDGRLENTAIPRFAGFIPQGAGFTTSCKTASSSECNGSSIVLDIGSQNVVLASSNETPWIWMFRRVFLGSHPCLSPVQEPSVESMNSSGNSSRSMASYSVRQRSPNMCLHICSMSFL